MDMKPLSIETLENLGFEVRTTKRKGVERFSSCSYEWDNLFLYFSDAPTFSQIIDSVIRNTKEEMYLELKREAKDDLVRGLINLMD